jgi:hypothetical protein
MRIQFAVPGLLTDSTSEEGRVVRQIIAKCVRVVGKAKLEPGVIVFNVVDAFQKQSSAVVNARALQALMKCLTDLNYFYLGCKPGTVPLYRSGVYYERTTIWDTIPALYARGYGDCKSLAACRVAELRRAGVPCRPAFRFIEGANMTMFHILVMNEDGTWEDPSKKLGMVPPQELAG